MREAQQSGRMFDSAWRLTALPKRHPKCVLCGGLPAEYDVIVRANGEKCADICRACAERHGWTGE